MIGELIHTSVPRGIRPGSRGFCTAAVTAGLPATLTDRLEGLSGYRDWLDKSPVGTLKPAALSHIHLRIGGGAEHIVSRIAPAPNDYTGRANKIAHHRIYDAATRPTGGPAWVLRQPGLFRESYSAEPALLEPSPPPTGGTSALPCRSWENATSDAGWAGHVLERLTRSTSPLYVLYPLGVDALALVDEMLALVPPAERWKFTFSTVYPGETPTDVVCQLRMLPLCDATLRFTKSVEASTVIRLDELRGSAGESEHSQCARAGRMISPAEPARRAVPQPAAISPEPDAWERRGPSRSDPLEPLVSEYDLETQLSRRMTRARDSMPLPPKLKFRVGWTVLLPAAAVLLTVTAIVTAFITRALLTPDGVRAHDPPVPVAASKPKAPDPIQTAKATSSTAKPPAAPPASTQVSKPTSAGQGQPEPAHPTSPVLADENQNSDVPAGKGIAQSPKTPPIDKDPPDPAPAPTAKVLWIGKPINVTSSSAGAWLLHPTPKEPLRILLPASFKLDDDQVKLWFDMASSSLNEVSGIVDETGISLSWMPKHEQRDFPKKQIGHISLATTDEGRPFLQLNLAPKFNPAESSWVVLYLTGKNGQTFPISLAPAEPKPLSVTLSTLSKHEYVSDRSYAVAELREMLNVDSAGRWESGWLRVSPDTSSTQVPITLERSVSTGPSDQPTVGVLRVTLIPNDTMRLEISTPGVDDLSKFDLDRMLKDVSEFLDTAGKLQQEGKGRIEAKNLSRLLSTLQNFKEVGSKIIDLRRFDEALADGTLVKNEEKSRILFIRDQTSTVRAEIHFPSIK